MDVEGRLGSGNFAHVKPINVGETAAIGQKLAGREKWVRVDRTGKATLVQVDKAALVQRLWIPFRDLRQLDPTAPIPYPSSIFIRERALVVNIESVRMIISKDEVYVSSIPVPGSSEAWQHPSPESSFIQDLCTRLEPNAAPQSGMSLSKGNKDMPFELRGLEAALTAGVTVLELAVANLERVAFPALETLLSKVSRSELDRTRHVKSLTTHLLSRVGRIKKEIEEILDDDQDMADMYLGQREDLETKDPMHRASLDRKDSSEEVPAHPSADPMHPQQHEGLDERRSEIPLAGRQTIYNGASPLVGERAGSGAARVSEDAAKPYQKGPRVLRTAHPHDIEDCENLLENYFMQMEFLHSRLLHLKERTDDTEDLINIELDQRRNELVSLDLVLTALATAFGFVACVGGIFGMNLSPLPIESTEAGFWAATFSAVGGGLVLMVAFLAYAYWKKILLIPSA